MGSPLAPIVDRRTKQGQVLSSRTPLSARAWLYANTLETRYCDCGCKKPLAVRSRGLFKHRPHSFAHDLFSPSLKISGGIDHDQPNPLKQFDCVLDLRAYLRLRASALYVSVWLGSWLRPLPLTIAYSGCLALLGALAVVKAEGGDGLAPWLAPVSGCDFVRTN